MDAIEIRITDIFKSRGMEYTIEHHDGFDIYDSDVNGKKVSITCAGGIVMGGMENGLLRVASNPCYNNMILGMISHDIDRELAKEGKA